jgi:hypothetical protein
MTSHAGASVPPVPHEFPILLGYLIGSAARAQTAYTVELTPFRRLLVRDATQLRLFVVTRAAVRPTEAALAPDGETPGPRLASHDQRPSADNGDFGNVRY